MGAGDAVFFVCDKPAGAAKFAGVARTEICNRLGLAITTSPPTSAPRDAMTKPNRFTVKRWKPRSALSDRSIHVL